MCYPSINVCIWHFIICVFLLWMYPPDPMNHVKILKGSPHREAPSKLVQLWYKTFPPDQRGQAKIKSPTRLSNKTSTAWSCAEDEIFENKNLQNMILNICTERQVKCFFEIYLPVREHIWLIGSGRYMTHHYMCYRMASISRNLALNMCIWRVITCVILLWMYVYDTPLYVLS